MEIPRLAALGLLRAASRRGVRRRRAGRLRALVPRRSAPRSSVRAVKALGVTSAVVPETFPLWLADRLRAEGVELTVDARVLRRPPPREDRGASSPGCAARSARPRRGWTPCATCCVARRRTATALRARRRAADRRAGQVRDGADVRRARRDAPTTSSSRRARRAPSATTWAPARSAPACRSSSTSGRATTSRSCFCDMTRTFVVGDVPDDVREWHRLCKEALDRAISEIKDGADGRAIFDGTCEIFEAAGEPTQRTKDAGRAARRRLLPRARARRRARGARGARAWASRRS